MWPFFNTVAAGLKAPALSNLPARGPSMGLSERRLKLAKTNIFCFVVLAWTALFWLATREAVMARKSSNLSLKLSCLFSILAKLREAELLAQGMALARLCVGNILAPVRRQ